MEHSQNAAAANAHAAAASTKKAATSARLAEIDDRYARSGDLAGFLREVGAAGLTLADLADWLAASGASGIPKFAVGGMLAKEHPGEAIVPMTCAVRIGGAAGGGGGGCGGGRSPVFRPSPDVLALLAELVAELRALRQDHAQMAKLLSRWDGDGLPGTSAANEASDAAERAAESTRRASQSDHRS